MLKELTDADRKYREAHELTDESEDEGKAKIAFECLFYIALVNQRLGNRTITQQALGLF